MDLSTAQQIFFVDDEPGIRQVAASILKRSGYGVRCFARAADCLKQLPTENCSLLITDLKMPGMDGMMLLSRVKRVAPWVPVVVISGYGDIAMAVRAMELGAVDFIEKPFVKETFIKKIRSVLSRNQLGEPTQGQPLTKTEKKILKLILDGKSNKETAYLMHRSVRTVELHRSHIMRKFDVNNIVDLVKKAASFDFEQK